MKFKALLTLAFPVTLLACNQSQVPDDIEEDVVVAEVKLHPTQQFCVEYEHSGLLSGTSKQCMRGWGAESFTIENFSVGIGGFTQAQNAHKITIGDTIYNIDPAAMTGTKTKNPLYEDMTKADPDALSAAMMGAMGLQDTGEDKTIAGVSCNVMRSAQLGGGACYTDGMVPLELDVGGVRQVATKVDLDSGGDAADYRLYEQAEITDGPDIRAILEQI